MFYSKKLSRFKNIKHAFFNKKGGHSKGIYKSLNCGMGSKDNKNLVIKNLKIVSNKIGVKKKNLILLNQIHSKKIYFLKKIPKKKLIGDGLITKQKKVGIGILTADCAPVLFYDKKKTIIGAAHVGWKGAYKKILPDMVKLLKKYGSKLKDICVVIGPCISKINYEVKKDFRLKFLSKSKENIKYFRVKGKKTFFDLKQYIYDQIKQSGISNIDIIKKDTFNKNNNFFSARRSLKNKYNDYGRNISIIMIK
tara:strand:- start:1289 stop:2041 length:753 start_codon:yes stop_codon:yes gene_type:complete